MTAGFVEPPGGRQSWRFTVSQANAEDAVQYLSRHTGLSKRKLKEAMTKGAVWLRRDRGKRKRLRRATTPVRDGDVLEVYFDPELLMRSAPKAMRLWHSRDYSVWYKPAGLLSQGSDYGDHVSLLRQVEMFENACSIYLVHRLDREAHGLMLLAHNARAAALLSDLFQSRRVVKYYEVQVRGKPSQMQGSIATPLDGKPAVSHYRVLGYEPQSNASMLEVRIETGRRHQIRRHLDSAGYPVLGDPQYGNGNKDPRGMQLQAVRLQFVCPLTQQTQDFDLHRLMNKPGA